MCDTLRGCSCHLAVTRAYRELREKDVPELWAFDTATRIYLMHHPEVPESEARFTIAEWID
jgi:hypothetical protein